MHPDEARTLRPAWSFRGTSESFDRRDLLAPLQARLPTQEIASAASWMRQARRPGGYFAGIDFFLDQIDLQHWIGRLPHSDGPIAADLASIEAVLVERAEPLGVAIRYECRVSDMAATTGDVVVRAGEQTFRGGWLVGCDGARSAVRKAAGFGFAGTNLEFTGYLAQIELADPTMLEHGHHDTPTGTYIFDLADMLRMVDFDGGAHHRGEPITREHLPAVLRRISGTRVDIMAVHRVTSWPIAPI